MKHQTIDIEALIRIQDQMPVVPWLYALYAYLVSILRRNNGNRTKTSIQIRMPLRSLRFKLGSMEVLGFEVPGHIWGRPKKKEHQE
jgi:hypothetical protein